MLICPSKARTIHGLFERQAALSPKATAITGAGRSLSYEQLDALASRIAAALIRKGIRPGQIVMIALERSSEMIAGFLGVLKVGAAYCPLDLQDPPARQALMFQDAQPGVILTTRGAVHRFEAHARLCLCIDQLNVQPDEPFPPPEDVDEQSIAAVMYTSGSTGQPKGILVPHCGIVRLFFGSDYIGFGPHLRTLFHSPPHFDASTFEIWASLLHGGTCAIFPGDRIPSLRAMREALRDFSINCLFLGPAFFNVIIDEDPHILAGVDDVLVGGEVMSVRHMRKALQQLPRTRFLNVYGPTETTTFATVYPVPVDLPDDAKSVPIGKPIGGTECYLLQADYQPAQNGATAELFIGGTGVARGYASRPELTAKCFIADPFTANPFNTTKSARMYRTGDLCRRLPDGNLDFVGRIDNQIKIRGHRVEPAEIETQLQQHPAIAQAVVVTGDHAGQTFLAAYYTLAGNGSANGGANAVCTAGQIREHLVRRLPPYLIPSVLHQLPRMPLTPSGAIDRAALPKPGFVPGPTSSPPTSPLEKELLQIWQTVLNEPAMGVDDGFFQMGGTSLDAMRLCLMTEKLTGLSMPISLLLAGSTVREFARALAGRAQTPPSIQSQMLVPFITTGRRAPIFVLGGDVGHPSELRELVSCLSIDRPVYGLQMPGLDGISQPLHSVQEAARFLCPTIRGISGQNPVYLMGYCFGGLIAYELACRLRDDSVTVGPLLLIDSWTAASYVRKPLAQQLKVRLAGRWNRGLKASLRQLPVLGKALPSPPAAESEFEKLVNTVRKANLAAFHAFSPPRYLGNIVSIRASDPDHTDLRTSHGSGGWEQVSGGTIETRTSPGNHVTMLRPPHVNVLAQLIRDQLADLP